MNSDCNNIVQDKNIQNFMKSKFWKRIFKHDVIFIALGGSRLCGVSTYYSDYDIFVIINEKIDEELNDIKGGMEGLFIIKGSGTRLHYNIISVYSFMKPNNLFKYTGLSKTILYSDKSILYKNKKYLKFIDFFLTDEKLHNSIKFISAKGIYSYLNKDFIKSIEMNDFIDKDYYGKFLYVFYFAFASFLDEDIDLNLLKKLRQTETNDLSKEDSIRTRNLYLKAHDYFKTDCSDLNKIKNETQNYLNRKLEELSECIMMK